MDKQLHAPAAPWPDPQRPGYPLHPERDGWHWIDRPLLGARPMVWREVAGGGWVDFPICFFATEAAENGWRYLGPCLPPSEAAALRVKVERYEQALRHIAREWPDSSAASTARATLRKSAP